MLSTLAAQEEDDVVSISRKIQRAQTQLIAVGRRWRAWFQDGPGHCGFFHEAVASDDAEESVAEIRHGDASFLSTKGISSMRIVSMTRLWMILLCLKLCVSAAGCAVRVAGEEDGVPVDAMGFARRRPLRNPRWGSKLA